MRPLTLSMRLAFLDCVVMLPCGKSREIMTFGLFGVWLFFFFVRLYWTGLAALASLPHVSIKISMLSYAFPQWDTSPEIAAAVTRVIDLFGAQRCMVASNFPVELKVEPTPWDVGRIYRVMDRLTASRTAEERALLFAGTARSVYRCPTAVAARL